MATRTPNRKIYAPTTICAQAFTVQINAVDMEPNELVAITGNLDELGEWRLERSIPLAPLRSTVWSVHVLLQSQCTINYRYFTYVIDSQGNKVIRRWETAIKPRSIEITSEGDGDGDGDDNGSGSNSETIDNFGQIENDGIVSVHRGWLNSGGMILQLKFSQEHMFHVIEGEEDLHRDELKLKLVPLCCDNSNFRSAAVSSDDDIHVEITKLKYGKSRLQQQGPFGVAYNSGDVVIFHLTMSTMPLRYSFALIFQTMQHDIIGRTLISPWQLQDSDGTLDLHISSDTTNDNQRTIAHLMLPYLIITPLSDVVFDLRATQSHYWPTAWPNLDVGHRGNGRSFIAEPPPECENTIASFMSAYNAKADMIELDVQLTSDGIPIIWHDFSVKTAPPGRSVYEADELDVILIKDIRYATLKTLRVFAVTNGAVIEYPSHDAEPIAENRIFPTLDEVLQLLPITLGIDVEIKWPQLLLDGQLEAEQTIDKNFYVDRVLQIVLEKSCGRPLIFSSFDADICTMVRFKQNVLPIMFLTMGETNKWKHFLDLRTRSFEHAVNFAEAFELIGTAPHAEDFIKENGKRLVKIASDLGQITLMWGDDCNSRERVKYFSDIGATAICYDRIDLHIPENKKFNFFSTPDAALVRSPSLYYSKAYKDEKDKENSTDQ